MAYYYYYQQQHHTPPDPPLTPGTTMPSELTPLLLLPPSQPPQQLALPLLAPAMPPVTSIPIKTAAVTTEHNQPQLPTPNTFIRICEDMGLFHDLQNIVVMSSLTGQSTDATVPVSTATTLVTTSTSMGQPTSNLCCSSTTAIMMANPFDETFKQAVLQQQKSDASLLENHFNSNNNDGDLNTPFITTTNVIDTSINNSTLSLTTSTDMMIKTVVESPTSTESLMTNITTMTQPQQQNMFITSSAEVTTENVLVMMVEQQHQQQQHNPIVSIQSQHQQRQHIIKQRQPQQRFIVPATTTTNVETTTMTLADRICYNEENNGNSIIANGGLSGIPTIKQALKQNLLVKRLMQGQQKVSVISESSHNYEQTQQQNNDVFTTNATIQNNEIRNNCNQDDDGIKRQQLKEKQKQALLERNRSAAKRSRMKRKQRWELLSEENRKLKVENGKLRDTITKLLSRNSADSPQQH